MAPDQIAEGIAAGAFYYLTKPYAGEALVGVVRSALESVAMAEMLRDVTAREAQCARMLRRAEMICVDLSDVQTCTAMIAATAAGLYGDLSAACTAMQQGGTARLPDPAAREQFDRDYDIFLTMLAQRRTLDDMIGRA